jgi:hypothetical protein
MTAIAQVRQINDDAVVAIRVVDDVDEMGDILSRIFKIII